MEAVCLVASADTANFADCIGGSVYRWVGELVRHIVCWLFINNFPSAWEMALV